MEVIKEENGEKLTLGNLRTLDNPSEIGLKMTDAKSKTSKISHLRSNAEVSKINGRAPSQKVRGDSMSIMEGQSILDQDDSYGNYRPTFLVKNHKVTGRTPQIIQLQRQASVDTGKALLGPI